MSLMAKTRGALPRPRLTHEERQTLIHQPFACERPGGCCETTGYLNTVIKGRTWGGYQQAGHGPTGRFGVMWDESYLRYGKTDDPRQGDL
jgi:hypothetical protein